MTNRRMKLAQMGYRLPITIAPLTYSGSVRLLSMAAEFRRPDVERVVTLAQRPGRLADLAAIWRGGQERRRRRDRIRERVRRAIEDRLPPADITWKYREVP